MADRIVSEVCYSEGDSATEVRDIDKCAYTEQFRPKGTTRVTVTSEPNDPTADNYSVSNS